VWLRAPVAAIPALPKQLMDDDHSWLAHRSTDGVAYSGMWPMQRGPALERNMER
jgi:hypothetical protein